MQLHIALLEPARSVLDDFRTPKQHRTWFLRQRVIYNALRSLVNAVSGLIASIQKREVFPVMLDAFKAPRVDVFPFHSVKSLP